MQTTDRRSALYRSHLDDVFRRRDRVFAWLMGLQWLFALVLAVVYSPQAWAGRIDSTHVHVYYALFLGGALSIPPILLAWLRPGWTVTRHAVAVSQVLWSALLIHLTGGRIETHFHVFVSLAFLAFYRDWTVLGTATVLVAVDHLLRGLFWSESVYGITNPEWWRFLEHAFWVVFEDIVLVMGIVEARREMMALASRQAELETSNETIERRVIERTSELAASREQYRSLVETTRAIPWQLGAEIQGFTYIGPQGPGLLGVPARDWASAGFWNSRVHGEDGERVVAAHRDAVASGELDVEFRLLRDDGHYGWVRSIGTSVDTDGARTLRGIMLDVTERRRLETLLAVGRQPAQLQRLAGARPRPLRLDPAAVTALAAHGPTATAGPS